jgi:putative hydrolase of the HAD superfamily
MEIKFTQNDIIIFDLDDTLYKEIDFVYSAFYEIASLIDNNDPKRVYHRMLKDYYDKKDVFSILSERPSSVIAKSKLIQIYRNHYPKINLSEGAGSLINNLYKREIKMAILTDGRSVTQRNKIQALSLEGKMDDVLISEEFGSEKPSERNYKYFEEKYPSHRKVIIGDNFNKDFVIPNHLGWITIGVIDDGRNIHEQNYSVEDGYLPSKYIDGYRNMKIIYDD